MLLHDLAAFFEGTAAAGSGTTVRRRIVPASS